MKNGRTTVSTVFPARGRPLACLLALGLAISLGACTSQSPNPLPAPSGQSVAPSDQPESDSTPTPAPSLLPNGSATDNLSYFDHINRSVLKADAEAGGQTFIDALAAGGFDKENMEVTRDETPTGRVADSIQFSVRFDGECIIGQTGPASGGYHSMVAAELGTGDCLVGESRPIDW